jgi:hypothetical protein
MFLPVVDRGFSARFRTGPPVIRRKNGKIDIYTRAIAR